MFPDILSEFSVTDESFSLISRDSVIRLLKMIKIIDSEFLKENPDSRLRAHLSRKNKKIMTSLTRSKKIDYWLPELTSTNLTSSALAKIEQDQEKYSKPNLFPEIKTLNLHCKYISYPPTSFFALFPNLYQLGITFEDLQNEDSSPFSPLKNIGSLNIRVLNCLSVHDEFLKGIENLKGLTIILPNIQNKVEFFKFLPKLTRLNLGNNQITKLKNGYFKFLPKLQILNLGSNQITKLENGCFSGLISLEELILFENPLEYLGEEIFTPLNKLRKLSLSGTKMTDLPLSLLDCTNMVTFDHNGKALSILDGSPPSGGGATDPQRLFKLIKLKKMALKQNVPFGKSVNIDISWSTPIIALDQFPSEADIGFNQFKIEDAYLYLNFDIDGLDIFIGESKFSLHIPSEAFDSFNCDGMCFIPYLIEFKDLFFQIITANKVHLIKKPNSSLVIKIDDQIVKHKLYRGSPTENYRFFQYKITMTTNPEITMNFTFLEYLLTTVNDYVRKHHHRLLSKYGEEKQFIILLEFYDDKWSIFFVIINGETIRFDLVYNEFTESGEILTISDLIYYDNKEQLTGPKFFAIFGSKDLEAIKFLKVATPGLLNQDVQFYLDKHLLEFTYANKYSGYYQLGSYYKFPKKSIETLELHNMSHYLKYLEKNQLHTTRENDLELNIDSIPYTELNNVMQWCEKKMRLIDRDDISHGSREDIVQMRSSSNFYRIFKDSLIPIREFLNQLDQQSRKFPIKSKSESIGMILNIFNIKYGSRLNLKLNSSRYEFLRGMLGAALWDKDLK